MNTTTIVAKRAGAMLAVLLCLGPWAMQAQTDWNRVAHQIYNGEYKNAYAAAERVYNSKASSHQRLLAARYMSDAASYYQEDAYDSSVVRYRRLLPDLDSVDRAVCYAMLGSYDTALMQADLLRRTPVETVADLCVRGTKPNLTPTVFDMLVVQMQDSYTLTPQQRVEWQRRIVAGLPKDNDDVRLWHDLRLLDFLGAVPNRPLPLDTLMAYVDKYRGSKCDRCAYLYYRVAQYYSAHADYVAAVRWCDSAIALYPHSNGAAESIKTKSSIEELRIDVNINDFVVAPGRPSFRSVRYRNISHLWFRVIPYNDEFNYYDNGAVARLRQTKPVAQWDVEVPANDEYRYEQAVVAMPALKAGRYLFLVSPTADFKKYDFMAYQMHCTDMHLMQNGNEGLLLDRTTGRPISGQELRLEYHPYNKPITVEERVVTDRDGRYRFNTKVRNYNKYLVVERDGYTLETQFGYSRDEYSPEMHVECALRTDRPIYKPGDTVRAAAILYSTDGTYANAMMRHTVRYRLMDPNSSEVVLDSVQTDVYGVASLTCVLPVDRLPGQYRLLVYDGNKHLATTMLRVEEYKQPKFMVTMPWSDVTDEASPAPQFGQPYTVRGMAASYSAVPLGGAKVKYTVVRSQLHRWWWRFPGYGNDIEVAGGETVTAADGSFEVTFTPQPDSSVELSTRPCFVYRVQVDVTDLNGESHPGTASVRVGYRNAFIRMDIPEEVRSLDSLPYSLVDLNGSPLSGKVTAKIELLQQPAVPLLDSPFMEQADASKPLHNTISRSDFAERFPLFAYDCRYNDRDTWPVASTLAQGTVPHGQSGVYRITLTADGADTLTAYCTVTSDKARKVQSQKLLWTEVDRTTAEVGGNVQLRMGSRFKDVEVYYMVRIGDNERDFRRIRLSDELKTVNIPVDSAMLGGFNIELFAVREGQLCRGQFSVSVPYSHKRLRMDITTFRDKLQPGEQEQWTLKVTDGKSGAGTSSAVIMTMYDDALNSYGAMSSWTLSPWRTNSVYSNRAYLFPSHSVAWLDSHSKSGKFTYKDERVWELVQALPRYSKWRLNRIMYKTASATARGEAPEVTTVLEVVSDEGEEESFAAQSNSSHIVAEVGGIGYDDAAAAKAMADEAVVEEQDVAADVQLRTNLNTLAFFVADLRTDSTGTATYRFTVPELLTKWAVKGMAFTGDLKCGTLDRSLVTQKPLMVQPNMPRFLRHGDSLAFMAKVMNLTDEDREVAVDFSLHDAAGGDEPICIYVSHVKVAAHGSAQVTFDVEVPGNVYVATYQIVATTDDEWSHPDLPRLSDGERGQLPVVTNRQAVTVSQALYINGVGEKHFSMPEFQRGDASREPRLVAAEVTDNPVWLAIKVMPYLKTMDNPSSIYLANQFYVNTLGNKILKELNGLDHFLQLAGQPDSRLTLNEDVKQTLLKATPWVQDAQGEEEQMRAVAQYFDQAALASSLRTTVEKLRSQQNADGGWSWMPDGRSSVWVTQQVLKRLSISKNQKYLTDKALSFVDREEQRDYERYVKPYLNKGWNWKPTDIDYLYTRSFYGKATTEAYRFYYSNALKSYRSYNNLYTQAQLALIFHRHGDRKQALDILHLLKQKALESDEMGLYWRDNKSGWWWYQRPIETQALIIQAFAEITPHDSVAIGQMQQWLLKQKQTTHWGNDEATTKAIDALMIGSKSRQPGRPVQTSLTVFGHPMTATSQGPEGYSAQRWTDSSLLSLRATGSTDIAIRKTGSGIAWGAVYYQFADDMDKIPASEMGITLKRTYVADGPLHVGDRIKVRIEISCDRAMDYLQLVDGRPSCLEPLSTHAGWRWSDGLSYYVTVNNTDTRCYIEHIDKGKYTFEYEVYVTNPGSFMAGPVTMQCMYAPEFRATAPATRLTVQ